MRIEQIFQKQPRLLVSAVSVYWLAVAGTIGVGVGSSVGWLSPCASAGVGSAVVSARLLVVELTLLASI